MEKSLKENDFVSLRIFNTTLFLRADSKELSNLFIMQFAGATVCVTESFLGLAEK